MEKVEEIPANMIRRRSRSRIPISPISKKEKKKKIPAMNKVYKEEKKRSAIEDYEEKLEEIPARLIRRMSRILIFPNSNKEEKKKRRKISRPVSTKESDSDVEVIIDRDEVDWGYNFVLREYKEWTTVTRPKDPIKTTSNLMALIVIPSNQYSMTGTFPSPL